MIRKILVGLDGSPSVTELALEWAKQFGAELTGVAVVDDLPNPEPGLYASYTTRPTPRTRCWPTWSGWPT
jgi:hypothetical protein